MRLHAYIARGRLRACRFTTHWIGVSERGGRRCWWPEANCISIIFHLNFVVVPHTYLTGGWAVVPLLSQTSANLYVINRARAMLVEIVWRGKIVDLHFEPGPHCNLGSIRKRVWRIKIWPLL